VGVDKCIKIHPKIQVNQYTKSASRVSVAFLKETGKINHDFRYNSNDITKKKVNSTHIQAATNLEGQASLYLWSQP
jgi:hypothetical protein